MTSDCDWGRDLLCQFENSIMLREIYYFQLLIRSIGWIEYRSAMTASIEDDAANIIDTSQKSPELLLGLQSIIQCYTSGSFREPTLLYSVVV
jgi:hypothetical protein